MIVARGTVTVLPCYRCDVIMTSCDVRYRPLRTISELQFLTGPSHFTDGARAQPFRRVVKMRVGRPWFGLVWFGLVSLRNADLLLVVQSRLKCGPQQSHTVDRQQLKSLRPCLKHPGTPSVPYGDENEHLSS